MRSIVLTLACGVAAIACPCTPAEAQPAPRPATLPLDCRATDVRSLTDQEIGPGWLAYQPDRLIARAQALSVVSDWGAAMDTVIARSGEPLRFVTDTSVRSRYLRELAETRRLFRKLLELPSARFMADSVRPVRWQLSENSTTGVFRVFAGPDQIVVTDSMSSDVRRALCWPALAVHGVLVNYHAPVRDATVEALSALAERWDGYIDNSYSQLPWELFVNGLNRSRREWEPPKNQWILVHPSVGLEIAGLSWDNLTRLNVAVVEGLGYLRYFADYTRYIGISGVATFPSERPAAFGGYLHLWYPQAKIGYVVGPDTDRKRRRSLLVTIDLYDLLTGVPKNLADAKNAALALRKAQPSKP